MDNQNTIQREVGLSGIGLHTGKEVRLTFRPAQAGAGINFIRTDLPGSPVIRASVDSLLEESMFQRRSSIGKNGAQINTVEHLMAALAGLCIDNIDIEIDNDEIPGMDGSSHNFLETLSKAGIRPQEKKRHYFAVKEPVSIEESNSAITILPSSEFKISYTLDYNHPFLKTAFLELTINPDNFREFLSRARTFCLEEEAGNLQGQGLGKGANYENTLVVSNAGVVKNKLRFDNEFIRHKILDLLGDLYLLGQPLKGHVIALKSGHSINLKLLKKIDDQRKRYVQGGIDIDTPAEGISRMDINQIMQVLPHRHPFLFVDEIISLERGRRIVGIKNVTMDDYFFKGHFPGKPVMPGVIILEAMAQAGGVMMLAAKENRGKIAYFVSINNAKFRKTVVPGDKLVLEVEAVKMKSKVGIVRGKALVDGKVAAEADLMFALGD